MKIYNTTSRTEARDRANIYFINSKAAARMETTKDGEITILDRQYMPLAHFAILK